MGHLIIRRYDPDGTPAYCAWIPDDDRIAKYMHMLVAGKGTYEILDYVREDEIAIRKIYQWSDHFKEQGDPCRSA